MSEHENLEKMLPQPPDLHKINFRLLVMLYLIQHSDDSQASIAKRLNTTPLILSRTLNSPHCTIRDEWVPEVNRMIMELDLDSTRIDLHLLSNAQKQLSLLDRQRKFTPILEEYICSKLNSGYVLSEASGKPFLCVFTNDAIDSKWRIIDVPPEVDFRPYRYNAVRSDRYSFLFHSTKSLNHYIQYLSLYQAYSALLIEEGSIDVIEILLPIPQDPISDELDVTSSPE